MLVFWGAAIFGSVFFALRVVLFVVGGFGADAPDGEASLDGESAQLSHSQELEASDGAFKLLSLNSVTGFIAMFGWAGLAAYSQYNLPFFAALLIAAFSGLGVLFVTAALFYFAMKLKSPGAEFDIGRAVGTTAEVYLQISPPGTGKISFAVNGTKHECNAVSSGGKTIPSFEKVTITGIVDSHTVTVVPYREAKDHEL
ncbi:MAG: hypothetical protein LBI85_06515 [Spirochaetaceae bacterium]|jgi:hypothetical protein|nr:hypothetical protein [Spirochaetaceae bacterium]